MRVDIQICGASQPRAVAACVVAMSERCQATRVATQRVALASLAARMEGWDGGGIAGRGGELGGDEGLGEGSNDGEGSEGGEGGGSPLQTQLRSNETLHLLFAAFHSHPP